MRQALQHEPGTSITSAGALATLSGTDDAHSYADRVQVINLTQGMVQLHVRSPITPKCPIAGAKTGRSPRDKRVVRESDSENDIWWNEEKNGSPNFEMDER